MELHKELALLVKSTGGSFAHCFGHGCFPGTDQGRLCELVLVRSVLPQLLYHLLYGHQSCTLRFVVGIRLVS